MSLLRDLFGPGTWGTGGNLVAWVLCGVAGGVTAFLLRNWIGPKLAGWWHRHHGKHLRAELEAMEARLQKRADEQDRVVREQLAVHCSDLKEHVTASAKPVVVAPKRGTR